MYTTRAVIDQKMTIKIDPLKINRGTHLNLSGSGKHSDKRIRRSTKNSRSRQAVNEFFD